MSADDRYPIEFSDYKIPQGMRLVRPLRTPGYYHALKGYIDQFEISSTTVVNFRSNEILYELMLKGMGAAIVSDFLIASKKSKSSDILFIPINNASSKRTICVSHEKNALLSEPAKECITILRSLCENKAELMKMLAGESI